MPGTPNAIAPGKRALNNMCPVIARDGGQPEIAVGASGGRRIMASVFQLLSFVADFGMDAGGGGASPADRRLRPERSSRRPAAARRRCWPRSRAEGEVELLEHGVMPINFACPNLIRRGPEGGGRHQRRRQPLERGGGGGLRPSDRPARPLQIRLHPGRNAGLSITAA